ncbi:hypothetical protein MMC20_007812 [Loxospora ochrophaea]|nr:hypothetical protein [Loxospora ochrophaea]
MDPISAIGVAAAVVQFLDVGMKITKRLSEYNRASPKEVPKSLQSINTQLPLLLNALSRVKTDVEVEKIDVNTRCILRGVVSGCMGLVEEVESIMNKVAYVPGESFGVKLRKVLTSMAKEEKIWAIDKSLQTYISVLILHHVIDAADVPSPVPEEISYFDVRERRVQPFVERDSLLQAIDTHLYDAARSQVKNPTVVLLVGEKGAGKTQLALEYCHQAHSLGQFRTVFWINAATPHNLTLGLESIAATIRQTTEGTRTEKLDFVKKFLGDRWHPWLLVLHNYDHSAINGVMDFLPDRGYGAIIFTTCDKSASLLGEMIEVPRFLTLKERENLRQTLGDAIENKHLDRIQSTVANGVDVNCLWYGEWTCLSRAVIHGLEEAVRLLMAHGANPNIQPGGTAPIYWAAGSRHTSIFQILLDYDDSIGFVPTVEDNSATFRHAAENGNADIVRMMLERRKVRIDSTNQYGRTALQVAAGKGHTAVVRLLLENGADPEKGEETGISLINAATNGHLEIVKILCLQGKMSPNTQLGGTGSTALCHAAELRDERTYKEAGVEMVKFLLDLGANPNLSGQGRSPLDTAALHGYESVVRLLLDHGADPTRKDALSFTPLLSAAKYKTDKMVSLLLQVKIDDPATRAEYFESALKYAARNGQRETALSVLGVGGININTLDYNGTTPLLLAIKGGHVPTARLLIRHGAQQDVPDKDGRLPLLLAAENGYDLVVKDLLRSCKTPNLKNTNEDTPLCLSAAKGHEKVVKLLLEHGADPEMTNKFGETPLDLAEEHNHEKVVELLEAAQTK